MVRIRWRPIKLGSVCSCGVTRIRHPELKPGESKTCRATCGACGDRIVLFVVHRSLLDQYVPPVTPYI
jgi:hypothetical protein